MCQLCVCVCVCLLALANKYVTTQNCMFGKRKKWKLKNIVYVGINGDRRSCCRCHTVGKGSKRVEKLLDVLVYFFLCLNFQDIWSVKQTKNENEPARVRVSVKDNEMYKGKRKRK